MTDPILEYLYPEDITGAATTNKVGPEKQTLNPPEEELDFHWIIPKATPFFRDTMKLFDVATGRELIRGTDWAPGHKFNSASYELQGIKGGVYGSILFYDKTRGGQVELREYQTLGGNWTLNETKILEMLDAKAIDPRFVTYEEVNGKPEVFPPIEHNHPADDLTGMREQVEATYDIAAAIRQRTEDWLANPPILMSQYFTKDEITVREMESRETAYQYTDMPALALPFPETNTSGGSHVATSLGLAETGTGGTLRVAAGLNISVGQQINGLARCRTRQFTTTLWNSQSLETNSTYYLRATVSDIGSLLLYTQKGADNNPIPSTLKGTPNAQTGGGFDSTQLDMLLAKVVTGAVGSVPVVTNLANAKDLLTAVTATGAATVDGANAATYSATFALNWGRKYNDHSIYAVVIQNNSTVLVDGGANYGRTVVGDRYSVTVGVSTNWQQPPSSPTGTITATFRG
jgi:hypothetical protein